MGVPLGAVVVFAEALAAVGLEDRDKVYWAGRATLLHRPEDRPVFDRVFAEFFDNRPALVLGARAEQVTVELDTLPEDEPGAERGEPEDDSPGERRSVRYSAVETLRAQDFARYSDEDWAEARRLMVELRVRADTRRTRRLRRAASSAGTSLDLARTVRDALGSDGEAVRRAWRAPASRPRRLVLLVDISGSMKAYARAFLRLAHATVVARPLGAAEAFVLGTRMTRITRQLRSRDPDAALEAVAAAVADWYGGTRLGEGLRSFNDRFGTRGLARGAVVVVLSDGWDRGDPDELGREMGRLHRVAHRIVWVNPLCATPGYEPLARGMAAALPYVDDFVDGHSLASLEELVALLADDRREQAAARRQTRLSADTAFP